MPVVLHPTPRRMHRTRENFSLGKPAALVLAPEAPPEIEGELRRILAELFPDIEGAAGEETESSTLRFLLFTEEGEPPEEVPHAVLSQAIQVRVSPREIEIRAGSAAGWMMGARLLRGLREGDELIGVTLLDWPSFPVRQIDLPWPADAVSEAALDQWLSLLAIGRINRLGMPMSEAAPEPPALLRESARRHAVTLVPPAEQPTFRLVERATLFPAYSASLPTLREAALAAEEAGAGAIVVSLGDLDAQTSLEALAYGALFAADCAWNPRKADLKAFRRGYSLRRFGFDSRAPVQVIDELQAAREEATGRPDPRSAEEPASPGYPDPSVELEAADPFDARALAGVPQPGERASAIEKRSTAAMAAMAPLQPDSEERAAALQGLQWTAQRLKLLGRRLGAAERVRELYRSAFVASASPRAVSQRLLRAAELLDAEGRALEEHRAEWHALWRRERRDPYDPETERVLRALVESLSARAQRLRSLRDQYIQTGSLPPPAAEGLEQAQTRLSLGISPARLPPMPSPAWWPEGGAARLRLEVDCPEPAAGMVWEVQVDFRALAGEIGAFNVRSARLMPLNETDEAGTERPCQLLRAGIALVGEAGPRSYYLYLDPEPGPGLGFRETRTSQSSAGVRLENRRMRLRLSPGDGFVSEWRLLEPGWELIPVESGDAEETRTASRPAWKVRVMETGPLLARARAEHADGSIRQWDLGAGHSWAEMSVNSPWTELTLPGSPELWTVPATALFEINGRIHRQPLTGAAVEAAEACWAAQQRGDGLTVAVLLPETPADVTISPEGFQLQGRPRGGRLLLFAGLEADPGAALARLLEAQRQPPRVRLGVIEERRVREF